MIVTTLSTEQWQRRIRLLIIDLYCLHYLLKILLFKRLTLLLRDLQKSKYLINHRARISGLLFWFKIYKIIFLVMKDQTMYFHCHPKRNSLKIHSLQLNLTHMLLQLLSYQVQRRKAYHLQQMIINTDYKYLQLYRNILKIQHSAMYNRSRLLPKEYLNLNHMTQLRTSQQQIHHNYPIESCNRSQQRQQLYNQPRNQLDQSQKPHNTVCL